MKEGWPDFWCDPRAVRDIRRRVQKPFSVEELWAWLCIRRVSIYVSLLLARVGRITPNAITAAAALLSVAMALWAAIGKPGFLQLALTYNFVYLLDCVDGELARLTDRTSRRGEWLDKLVQLMLLSLPCALGINLIAAVDSGWVGGVAIVLFINTMAGIWLTIGAQLALRVDVSSISVPARKKRLVVDCAILCFATDHGLFTGLPVVAAVFRHHPQVAALVWFGIHSASALAKNVWRLHGLLKLPCLAATAVSGGEESHGSPSQSGVQGR